MEPPSGIGNDIDARTVFVRKIAFSLSDAQLEEAFSDIGPIRRCFTVRDKGAAQNRGFGFVQFAVAEDAKRAVEIKDGSSLQGRKIKVEVAKRRQPLNERCERRSKPKDDEALQDHTATAEADVIKASGSKEGVIDNGKKKKKKKEDRNTLKVVPKSEFTGKGDNVLFMADTVKPRLEAKGSEGTTKTSEKQKPARTVVIGGLVNEEVKEATMKLAKTISAVESIQFNLLVEDISHRGLAKDGCMLPAAAIVYTSVKSACQAVAALHQKIVEGDRIWARQLGGEGSKTKKWRLIVRNLSFETTEAELNGIFGKVGFVWQINIPCNADGKSRGFAFVGFTCKRDAEQAINDLNGKKIGKRTVAVDWAVSKKNYEKAGTASLPAEDNDIEQDGDTASEAEDLDEDIQSEKLYGKVEHDFGISDTNEAAGQINEVDIMNRVMEKIVTQAQTADDSCNDTCITVETSSKPSLKTQKPSGKHLQPSIPESDEQQPEEASKQEALRRTIFIRNVPLDSKVDDMKKKFSAFGEVKSLRLVLHPITKRPKGTAFLEYATYEAANLAVQAAKEHDKRLIFVGRTLLLDFAVNRDAAQDMSRSQNDKETERTLKEEVLRRTIFIRNVPLDTKVDDMKKRFSAFGEVKSLRLVLHPITKRPKGKAFLEYATYEAANLAVQAAKDHDNGLIFGGRTLLLDFAVNQDAARDISRSQNDEHVDRRNLYLAKEGSIEDGTPAAEGVSKGDLMKRKMLGQEKGTKLRSPNFHVSKTRLAVHNFPKTMTEKEMKQIFINAVKQRASKQHPVIKQVKLLKDEQGRSRGGGFVEFTEHQHALVALRVLNNNPDTFGPERRPIVEFAIENSLKLKKRETRLAMTKPRKDDAVETKNERKRPNASNEASDAKESIAGKRTKRRKSNEPEGNHGAKRKSKESNDASDASGHATGKRRKLQADSKADGDVIPKRASKKERRVGQSNDKQQIGTGAEKTRRQRRREAGKAVPEIEEKLEKLMSEYRSRYFSSGAKSDASVTPKKELDMKRWFD